MLENIALIKEVQKFISTKKAQEEGFKLLDKINLAEIGLKRVGQCSSLELFYVMFIRALMTQKNYIIINMPYAIIHNLHDIKQLINNLELLNNKQKKIFILDTLNHKMRYNFINHSN